MVRALKRPRTRTPPTKIVVPLALALLGVLTLPSGTQASRATIGGPWQGLFEPEPSHPPVGFVHAATQTSAKGSTFATEQEPSGKVAYTLDAFNRTLIRGTAQPDHGGFLISSLWTDAPSGRLYLGAEGGDVLVVDLSRGFGERTIPTAGGVHAMAVDRSTGELWTAGDPWGVSVINLSTGNIVVPKVLVPGSPVAMAFDPVDQRIYVASRY